MCIGQFGDLRDGYYDDEGNWQRTKFCFVACGSGCTCGPPMDRWYAPEHDKNKQQSKSSPESEIADQRD